MMALSLRTNTPADPAAPLRRFLGERYTGEGWLCVGHIDGEPGTSPMRQEWYHLPSEARRVSSRYLELAAAGCNLYAGVCLFSAAPDAVPERTYAAALPSPWLWADDLPAGADATELIESSPGNFQGWRKMDRALTAAERSALQRAWRAESGADACSADAVHMARVPLGYNTKGGQRWAVRLASSTGTVYPTPATIDTSAVRTRSAATGATVEAAAWQVPEGSGARLAKSARFTRLCEKNGQLAAVVSGEGVTIAGDSSRSAWRSCFVKQLLKAHYPEDEIRALALHFSGLLDSGRGTAIFESDIDRLLTKYRPSGYKSEATRGRYDTTQQDAENAPRGGRHHTLTDAELYDRLCELADGRQVHQTIGELAADLGASWRTVHRAIGRLRDAGRLRIVVSEDRQRSTIELAPAQWVDPDDVVTQRIAEPQTPHSVEAAEADVLTELETPQQDAAEAAETAQCVGTRAHVERTHHLPAQLVPDGAAQRASLLAALYRRQGNEAEAQRVEQQAQPPEPAAEPVAEAAQPAGECVLSRAEGPPRPEGTPEREHEQPIPVELAAVVAAVLASPHYAERSTWALGHIVAEYLGDPRPAVVTAAWGAIVAARDTGDARRGAFFHTLRQASDRRLEGIAAGAYQKLQRAEQLGARQTAGRAKGSLGAAAWEQRRREKLRSPPAVEGTPR